MHYFQFNISDYQSHTKHLSDMEDLAYRRMLDWCYLHELPLPESVEEIAKKLCMRSHCECITDVLLEFFTLTDEGYIQTRIKKEIDAFHAKSAQAKASADARWAKNRNKIKEKEGDANALRPDCERNAKHKTLNTKHKPSKDLVTDKPPPAKKYKFSDWDMDFSKQAFNLITKDLPNAKQPNYESWANDCRKMREIDNRPKEEMIKLWQWIRQDSFWHSNILSMSKFKSKYDQLLLKSGVSGNGQTKTSGSANNQSIIGRLKNKAPTLREYQTE